MSAYQDQGEQAVCKPAPKDAGADHGTATSINPLGHLLRTVKSLASYAIHLKETGVEGLDRGELEPGKAEPKLRLPTQTRPRPQPAHAKERPALSDAQNTGSAPTPPPSPPVPAGHQAAPPDGPPSRRIALEGLQTQLLDQCPSCSLGELRLPLLFGQGNPEARVVFVSDRPTSGQSPTGSNPAPFQGAARELLDKMIAAMGLQSSDIYISTVVKCCTPDSLDIQLDTIVTCEELLARQLAIISPQAVVALGAVAASTLTRNPGAPISSLRGRWFRYNGIPLMATHCPDSLLREAALKREAWHDLQKVMERLSLSPKRAIKQ